MTPFRVLREGRNRMDEEHLLNCKEVAGLLNVSLPYIYRLIRSGDLPFFRVGRTLRIRRKDVETYIEYRNTYWRHPAWGKDQKK